LEVAVCGAPRADALERVKIRRVLARNAALAARLASAFETDHSAVTAEVDRVAHVIRKIGCALWSYETAEPVGVEAASVAFAPLGLLSQEERQRFVRVDPTRTYPEVGSRLMIRTCEASDDESVVGGWIEVQRRRFSYAVEIGGGGRVKMIVRDYLAAEVWFGAGVLGPRFWDSRPSPDLASSPS